MASATTEEQMVRETLLEKKVYYDGCPGCTMDRRKDTYPGIPYKEFLYVWIITLAASLPISSLFPFLYFMNTCLPLLGNGRTNKHIFTLHGVLDEGKRFTYCQNGGGYWFLCGLYRICFMFGRALTSAFWGIVSDRYGRKPVVIIGTIFIIIFNSLFGLSVNFWMAISTRFLLGFTNGILGPIRAYSTEICRPEHQALGLSLITTAWSIGLIIGPAIGGFFSQPAEKYPQIFSHNSLFGRFPYFLPCLCISAFAACTLVASLWLPESLHTHREDRGIEPYETLESSTTYSLDCKTDKIKEVKTSSWRSLFSNWPLMSSIIVYCVFSFHDMAYTEIFSLWAVSDKKYGGLSFSSEDVGVVLGISGCSLLVFQLILYPLVERNFGAIIPSRIAAALTILLLGTYSLYSNLSGFLLIFVTNCASILKNIFSASIIIGLFILQNNAVEQHQRGAANGIAMAAQSIFKAIAPAAGGALFSLAQKRQDVTFLPGDQLVFFGLNVVSLLGLILTFKPFLTEPNK